MPLLPDSKVAARYGVCKRTIIRWSLDEALGFPGAVEINGRRYRDVDALDQFDAERVRVSMRRRKTNIRKTADPCCLTRAPV